MRKPTVVISLGGSVVVPDEISGRFLKRFRDLIVSYVDEGWRFIIFIGGGMTARRYQRAARSIVRLTNDDLDWLGIHATRLNAHLLRAIFRDYAYPRLITSRRKVNTKTSKPIIIAAGFRPGASTDLRAVQVARAFGVQTILNLSNIDWVYTRDPKKYRRAKRIESISWTQFRRLVGTKWDPGANLPFDPVASRWADRWGMRVIITRGTDLANFKKILDGKQAKGTVIS